MAEREAAVKLTLDNAQFMVTIKRTGDEVDKAGKRGQKSMDLFGAGAASAKKSFMDLGGAVKNTLKLAGSLGGAFSVGNAIRGAVRLSSTYSSLAFRIKSATGEMYTAADVQQLVERSAAKTGRTNEEMAESFGRLRDATGDTEFARNSLEAVGNTATATHQDLGDIITVADQLHTKFGVSAENMQDAMAQVWQAAGQGGPAFSELADVVSAAGAELLSAGLSGQKGLNFMLGALVKTDDAFKSLPKQITGLKAVLRGLGEEGELKKLAAKLSIDPKKLINEKDALARLRTIFGKGEQGVKELLAPMHQGEEKDTMKILFTDPFEQALKDAQKSGLNGKAAIDKALVTFDAQIKNFGLATLTGADIVEEAARKRQEPEAQLNAALNNLNTAFSRPEIVGAINQLSVHLPQLAKIFGDLVSFAAKNPILAASLGLGVKGASSFFAGMASEIIKAHITGVRMAAGGAGAGGSVSNVAGKVAGAAGEAGGMTLTDSFGTPMNIPTKKSMAEKLGVGDAAGKQRAFVAGSLILGTALDVYGIASEQIGNRFAEEADVMKELSEATLAASNGGSLEDQKAALARLEKANAAALNANVGGGFVDNLSRGILGAGHALGINDAPTDTGALADQQFAMAGTMMARRKHAIDQLQNKPAAVPAASAEAGAVETVKAKADASPRVIAAAMATALGGKILTVRIANPGELGLGKASPGPGGSRGPMVARPTTPGGGT